MRFTHVVYCDDIRQEVGEKTSLIGLYNGQLGVPDFPCSLPKLCIIVSVSTPKDEIIEDLILTGSYSDAEIFKMEMGKEQIQSIVAKAPTPKEEGKYFMLQLMVILSPLQLEKPGKLKLDLLADGEKVYCAGLEVIQI